MKKFPYPRFNIKKVLLVTISGITSLVLILAGTVFAINVSRSVDVPASTSTAAGVGTYPIVGTGHGMMGISLAPITGQLVADTLTGARPRFDLSLLSPDRHSG